MKRVQSVRPVWMWLAHGLSICELIILDYQVLCGPLAKKIPIGVNFFAMIYSLIVISFSGWGHRILYVQGEWVIKEKTVTLNPGAERWFLPLYLSLTVLTAVAAGIVWHYGVCWTVVFPVVQLGMVLIAWKCLKGK